MVHGLFVLQIFATDNIIGHGMGSHKIHKKHHVICSQEAIMLSAGGEAPPIYSRSTNFCRRAPEHRRHATTRRCTRSDQTGGSAPSWNCDPGVSLEAPPYTAAGSVLVPPRPTP